MHIITTARDSGIRCTRPVGVYYVATSNSCVSLLITHIRETLITTNLLIESITVGRTCGVVIIIQLSNEERRSLGNRHRKHAAKRIDAHCAASCSGK